MLHHLDRKVVSTTTSPTPASAKVLKMTNPVAAGNVKSLPKRRPLRIRWLPYDTLQVEIEIKTERSRKSRRTARWSTAALQAVTFTFEMKDIELDIYGKITKLRIIDTSSGTQTIPSKTTSTISMAWCKKSTTPLLKHWGHVPPVPSHRITLHKVTNEFDK